MAKNKANDEIEKKIEKVETLLFSYKKNKARFEILEEGLITDDDFIMGSFDYSSERVQTSNISSLDNRIISREEESERLGRYIKLTDKLLGILKERERFVVTNFYIKRMPIRKIRNMINRDDDKTVWNIKRKALEDMAGLI